MINNRKAYIIGNGIAGMAAAVFLISDAGMKGSDITIIDEAPKGGGSFDGQGSAEDGYLCRGYRMFEEKIYSCSWDLFSKIPSHQNPGKTLKDEFFEFNDKVKIHAKARLVDGGKIIDARKLGLRWRDRIDLIKMLYLPEAYFGDSQIKDHFSAHFFMTNFWLEWATTFSFEPWHSFVEMKRYLSRFIHDAPQLDMTCVLSAPYCEHDFIVVPLTQWLEKHGVRFSQNRKVTDLEFSETGGKKAVTEIVPSGASGAGHPADGSADGSADCSGAEKIKVSKSDLVFITNGSMTADSSIGSMEQPPLPHSPPPEKSAAWGLWKNISKKIDNSGNPSVFYGSPEKSKWVSFTVTMNDESFFKHMESFTGNKTGTGCLVTFKDSNWLMTVSLPYQPYFVNQPPDTFVFWGYGLFPDKSGNYVRKKMSDCSGKEILEELCHHLKLIVEVKRSLIGSICIPAMMPYITSQFLPRKKTDRPLVVPAGSRNFAFIGQFVEIPREIVFTVEAAVRSAKIAVDSLCALKGKIPPLIQKKYDAKRMYRAIRTIFR